MKCIYCGMENPDNAQLCGNCKQPMGGAPNGMNPPFPNTQYNNGNNIQVPDYLVWSILELLFCCLPFGIVGLIYSIQANSSKSVGNINLALQQADNAKKFLIWGIVGWGIGIVLYIGLMILAGIAQNM